MSRVALVLTRALVLVVLAVSGAYLLVYLYRWEWNRALIAGVFFVAAEVAVFGSAILRRLARLEAAGAGVPAGPAPPPDARTLEHLRAGDVDRPNPFQWLDGSRTAVFVPILLGAGVILSALAYLVERAAQATAVPAMDRVLATRLAALAPPAGGLLGPPVPLVVAGGTRARPALSWPTVARALAAVVAVAVVTAGVGALADATQSRGDGTPPASSAFEVAVRHRGPRAAVPVEGAAEAMWYSCRNTVARGGGPEVTIRATGAGTAVLHLTPGLGPLRTKRFTGCLEDATVPRTQARVVGVAHLGAPS